MAKQISHYICQECGFESPKWEGQCSGCNKWNSFVETLQVKTKGSRGRKSVSGGSVIKLSQVKAGEIERVKTGIGELDRVLGEGLVPGSVMLLAGEPGIGKSTLLTQLATRLKNVLYVCGEESPSQVKLRVDRLKVGGESLLLLPETDTDVVVGQIGNEKNLGLVIVDSIQTMQTGDLSGMAGSVGQIRESANRLIEICKKKQIPLVLVGHVTKEGSIAGPKVLEHMVDVVLTLEGDKQHDFRILRGGKNRFGAVDEVGVFSMGERGLVEVKNPSGVFLDETGKSKAGSVVVPVMAGLRPICVEIQALVVPTQLAVPRRVSTGVDQRKITLLSAVLQKHCRLGLGTRDIFVNVVGGLNISEPACDLGLALAIASGFSNKRLINNSIVVGEVGLLGEIRRVGRMEARVKEAKKLGYTRVIGPGKHNSLSQVIRGELR